MEEVDVFKINGDDDDDVMFCKTFQATAQVLLWTKADTVIWRLQLLETPSSLPVDTGGMFCRI